MFARKSASQIRDCVRSTYRAAEDQARPEENIDRTKQEKRKKIIITKNPSIRVRRTDIQIYSPLRTSMLQLSPTGIYDSSYSTILQRKTVQNEQIRRKTASKKKIKKIRKNCIRNKNTRKIETYTSKYDINGNRTTIKKQKKLFRKTCRKHAQHQQ